MLIKVCASRTDSRVNQFIGRPSMPWQSQSDCSSRGRIIFWSFERGGSFIGEQCACVCHSTQENYGTEISYEAGPKYHSGQLIKGLGTFLPTHAAAYQNCHEIIHSCK